MADQAVVNRRLKPIYDTIDSGQYKKAIQEADKVLKKHPNTMTAKALKALALIRMERTPEAWPLIDAVEAHIKSEEAEENTVQAMVHCYKEAFVPDRITKMYEIFCERHPQNEQLMTQLFIAYVRTRDFKQQQRVAKVLYKNFQKTPYYYWHVMSIVMQAMEDERIARTVLLPLAEKMVSTFAAKNSFGASGELELYVMILDVLQKYRDAVDAMESHGEGLVSLETVQHRSLGMLLKAGNHAEVVERSLVILSNNFDEWSIWQYLLCSAIPVIKTSEKDAGKKVVDQMTDLVLNLATKAHRECSTDQRRMAYLAKLSLITALTQEDVMKEEEFDNHPLHSLFSNLKQYIGYTYTKPICYGDIVEHAKSLSSDARAALYKYLKELTAFNVEKSPSDSLWSRILHQRLRLAMGDLKSVSPAEARTLTVSLFNSIVKHREAPSELIMSYAVVITALLWELFHKHRDSAALLELLCIMEYFAENCPPCPLVRVVLCRIYGTLGCISKVHEQCRQLDVKYIQKDTLGYLLFPLPEQYGRYKTAIVYYTQMSAFYDQNERETIECLVNAYKSGSFTQVPKLVDFAQRCTLTLYTVCSDVNNRLLSAIFTVENLGAAVETLCGDPEEIAWHKVVDNRDYGLLAKLRPDKSVGAMEDMMGVTRTEAMVVSKLRDLICRTVGLMGRPGATQADFETKLVELAKHITFCTETFLDEDWYNELEAFTPLYFAQYLRNGHLDYIMSLFDVTRIIFAAKESLESKGLAVVEEEILKALPATDVFDGYSLKITLYEGANDEHFRSNVVLRSCADALKTFMLAMVILKLQEVLLNGYCGDALRGASVKNKKAKTGKGLVERFDQYRASIVMAMERVQQTLLREMDSINKGSYLPEANLDKYNANLKDIATGLATTLREDYSDSVSDMLATIRREDRLFDGMKFAQLSLSENP